MQIPERVRTLVFIPQFVPRAVALAIGIITLTCVQALVATGWNATLVTSVNRAATAFATATAHRWLTGPSTIGLVALAAVLLFSSPR